MEIRINDGDKIAIVGSKGRFGSYLIVQGLDGGAVARTDASRDIFDKSENLTKHNSSSKKDCSKCIHVGICMYAEDKDADKCSNYIGSPS